MEVTKRMKEKLKYIELKENKEPINRSIIYSSYEELENAGLLINDTVVVVDFDNDNKNEKKILEYLEKEYLEAVIVKTDKGKHFYFSTPIGVDIKNWNDTISVGGFQVDYKTGNQYLMVKHKGLERERNKDLTLEGLPELPPILYPLPKQKENLSGLKEGDGRNSAIFRHLGFIRRTYPDIEIDEISTVINNVTFEEPLDEKEIESVVESAKKYEYASTPKDIIKLAQYLINELDIKMYNTQLYFQQDNKYISDNRLLLKRVNDFCKLKKSQDTEILHQINKFADEVDTTEKELPILIRNGMILEGEFLATASPAFSPFFLDVSFDASAYDVHVDKFLNDITCERPELRKTLEEILGHILLTNKFPHHVFFLSGNGYNGKSTFLEMINNFVGELGQNLSLDAFNDGTSVATLNGKLSNCSDETDDIYIDRCKGYKSLASGNTITVRPIYSKPIKVQNTATLILSANTMPKFKDKTEGFFRRLVIIPFDFKITEKISDMDNLLSSDNAKSYILNLALKGVKRIKENGYKISNNEILKNALEEYKTEIDHIAGFVKEYSIIEGKETNAVFNDYLLYCGKIGIYPLALSVFTRRLKEFGYSSTTTTIDKKSVRVYKKTH
jgi:putative DNA primase/helicase